MRILRETIRKTSRQADSGLMATMATTADRRLQAVILAGGEGTRLGSLTRSTPKPLLPVAGRPFLDYLLWNLWRYGIGDVVLLAGYLADRIEAFVARSDFPGMDIVCVTEPGQAGTGGALLHAASRLKRNFLLLNGDSLFDINVLDLIDEEIGLGSQVGRLALCPMSDATRSGTVRLSGERISHFAERPGRGGPGLINGGVYWLSREILDFVSAPPCSLERDVFPQLAESGRLDGRCYGDFFIDIGTAEDLERSESLIPSCFHRPAAFLRQSAVVKSDTGDGPTSDHVKWNPGAVKVIRMLNDSGYYVFVLSPARPGGSTHVRPATSMNDWLRGAGAHVDGLLDVPAGGEERPGDKPVSAERTLRDAMSRWNVRKRGSILVGDGAADIALADALGIAGRSFAGEDLRRLMEDFVPQHP